MPSNVSVTGVFTSNTVLPAEGIQVHGKARLLLRGVGANSTWGGGLVKVLVQAADGVYQPSGLAYTAGVCELIDFGEIPGRIRLEMSGAAGPSLGFEVTT